MSFNSWNVIALTNGSLELTQKLLEQSGSRQYFTEVHSCDELEITKPHPRVYQLLPQIAGSVWMVAAHTWDIAGAIRAGLKMAFVTAGEGDYLSIYPQPDVLAPDLMGAVEQIIARESAISP
ncbi:Haloacetate dehalogenase H-2 [Acaryochloris thomasi RCC1774]|uniref:Haloacetate dehalogenase H-2 n=1 Tax=Acaryochloris thomasi RCC1774 TaxID=1764569 RepID=A0A2W1J9P5_9CYAN|nr:HAD family hydrolase [Acaryochloris thomasi]PZD70983.1 Haloacetate dehalogenase H-2 [Acaryochloris thomasi RCC1774]